MKAPCFDVDRRVSNGEERDEEHGRVETYAISREIDDSLLRDLPNSLVDSLEFIGNTRNVLD